MGHPNEGTVRDIYAAMARGDGRAIGAPIHTDAVWHIPGHSQLTGTYTGLNEVFDFWRRVAEMSDDGLRLEVLDVLANDERAAGLSAAGRPAAPTCSRNRGFTTCASRMGLSPRRGSTTRIRTPMASSGAGEPDVAARRVPVHTPSGHRHTSSQDHATDVGPLRNGLTRPEPGRPERVRQSASPRLRDWARSRPVELVARGGQSRPSPGRLGRTRPFARGPCARAPTYWVVVRSTTTGSAFL